MNSCEDCVSQKSQGLVSHNLRGLRVKHAVGRHGPLNIETAVINSGPLSLQLRGGAPHI